MNKIINNIIICDIFKFIFCALCISTIFVGCSQSSTTESISVSNSDNAKQKAVNAFNNKLKEYTIFQAKEWQEKGRDIKLIKSEFSEKQGDIYYDDRPQRTTNEYIATAKGRNRFLQISAEAAMPAGLFQIIETENESLLKDFKLYIHLNDDSVWLCTAEDIKYNIKISQGPAQQFDKKFKDSKYNLWAMYYSEVK